MLSIFLLNFDSLFYVEKKVTNIRPDNFSAIYIFSSLVMAPPFSVALWPVSRPSRSGTINDTYMYTFCFFLLSSETRVEFTRSHRKVIITTGIITAIVQGWWTKGEVRNVFRRLKNSRRTRS